MAKTNFDVKETIDYRQNYSKEHQIFRLPFKEEYSSQYIVHSLSITHSKETASEGGAKNARIGLASEASKKNRDLYLSRFPTPTQSSIRFRARVQVSRDSV